MNKGIVYILFIVFSTEISRARIFTDAKGRQVDAELVAHAGEKVVILRGGKKFAVPISMFSEADRTYVRAWINENPDKIDLDYKFRFFADVETKRSTMQRDGAAVDDKVKFNDNLYEFIVYNNGETEVIDVSVRYEIYVADFVVMKGDSYAKMAYGYSKTEKLEVIAGEESVKSIPVKGRFDLKRDFSTEFYIDRDGGVTDEAAQDKVIGAIIRVYKGDKMLAEYKDGQDDKRFQRTSWKDKAPGKQER